MCYDPNILTEEEETAHVRNTWVTDSYVLVGKQIPYPEL